MPAGHPHLEDRFPWLRTMVIIFVPNSCGCGVGLFSPALCRTSRHVSSLIVIFGSLPNFFCTYIILTTVKNAADQLITFAVARVAHVACSSAVRSRPRTSRQKHWSKPAHRDNAYCSSSSSITGEWGPSMAYLNGL